MAKNPPHIRMMNLRNDIRDERAEWAEHSDIWKALMAVELAVEVAWGISEELSIADNPPSIIEAIEEPGREAKC